MTDFKEIYRLLRSWGFGRSTAMNAVAELIEEELCADQS